MATVKLPASDGELLRWANHFSPLITATPQAFGLSDQQAADFQLLLSDYASALVECVPSRRSKTLVVEKNGKRAALKKSARLLASIIQGQTNVNDVQKTELGLTVRRPPTIAPPPADSPTLWVESVSGVTAKVRIGGGGSTGRARPGVDGVVLFSFVGDEPPTDLAGWKIERLSRRLKIQAQFPASTPPGARVWFTAQFFNSRKQTGPLSAPIGANLPGGGVVMTTALARAA